MRIRITTPIVLAVTAATLVLTGCGGNREASPAAGADPLRVVGYNIRHGRGMDDSLDLARTTATLADLRPDLVGLQEVDERVERSGSVDEAAELGAELGMEHAFGAFMPYQGGRYGMAILSRYPITSVNPLQLPEGNEPRIALMAEVVLPTNDTIAVINVHFDWVRDDGFRFDQASTLATVLDTLSRPWILLGDFNDVPESRTLELFRGLGREAGKEAGSTLTFPADEPAREIDFVFTGPGDRWEVLEARAVDERVASDHRPVLAVVRIPEG